MNEGESGAPPAASGRLFGAALVAFAAAAWFFARGEGGVRLSPGDPGPWFVPRVAATIVGLCGATDLLLGLRSTRRDAVGESSDGPRWTPGDVGTVIGLGAYVAVIPWLGFSLASLVAGPLFMARQGLRWPWWSTVLLAIGFVVFVKWLFGSIFGVMIPEGFIARLVE